MDINKIILENYNIQSNISLDSQVLDFIYKNMISLNKTKIYTRKYVFSIIGNMLLNPNFPFTFKNIINTEKIKFIISYFNFMYQNPQLLNESLYISKFPLYYSNLTKYCKFEAKIHFTNKKIEDIEQADKIIFANKIPGGGILGRGRAQEEIMFLCAPELFLAKYLYKEIKDNEVIYMMGVNIINSYTGYSKSLKFNGTKFIGGQSFIFMDSKNYYGNPSSQFANIRRDYHKACAGFSNSFNKTIATGHWGCGAFHSFRSIKFILQYAAASIYKKELYYTIENDKDGILFELYSFLKHKNIENILKTLENSNELNYIENIFKC